MCCNVLTSQAAAMWWSHLSPMPITRPLPAMDRENPITDFIGQHFLNMLPAVLCCKLMRVFLLNLLPREIQNHLPITTSGILHPQPQPKQLLVKQSMITAPCARPSPNCKQYRPQLNPTAYFTLDCTTNLYLLWYISFLKMGERKRREEKRREEKRRET